MMKLRWLGLLLVVALLAGCGGGGGGGGGNITITGTVLEVSTGIAPNPVVNLSAGGASGTSSASDGTFSLKVASGTSSLTITQGSGPTFTYVFPPVTTATNVGFLYVGSQAITVQGKVVNAESFAVVPDANISVLGRTGVTLVDGTFSIPNVAWSASVITQYPVTVQKTGFVTTTPALEGTLIGSVLTMADILFAPESDTNPPPLPYTLWGRITEAEGGSAVLVHAVRQSDHKSYFFVTGDINSSLPQNEYVFWLGVGTYDLEFFKPSATLRATVSNVQVVSTDHPVRQDVSF